MATHHKFQLTPQDQQLFSFGKKFFGKKLDQIRKKKDFVQTLREKGLMDYLDPQIINNDMDHLFRFSKSNGNHQKHKVLMAPHSTKNLRNNPFNEEFKAMRIGIRPNHFRNIKNPNKTNGNTEKNYVNNVMVRPKYNQIKNKTFLSENNKHNIKSMPMILFSDEPFEKEDKVYGTAKNITSFQNIPSILEQDFLNFSKSINDFEAENKEMEEKMDFLKNYLGKENKMFKIRNHMPLRRGTSIEIRK